MIGQKTSQHVNPILVFVNSDTFISFIKLVTCQCIPKAIGVANSGNLEVAQEGSHYLLVFVDDGDCIKSMRTAPCKTCTSEPLLVVEHNNSDKNKGPWNDGIWNVVPAIVVETFSHEPSDPVYLGIRDILNSQRKQEGNSVAAKAATTALVQLFRNKNLLAALDGLATVCQIQLLGEDGANGTPLKKLEAKFLARYRGNLADDYMKKGPHDKLSKIQEEANKELGMVSGQAS